MSRNIGSQCCSICAGAVCITSEARPITKGEAKGYFDEFKGMYVAEAQCKSCWAKYLAWVFPATSRKLGYRRRCREGFYDLSFRHSFNDEPSDKDYGTVRKSKKVLRKIKTRSSIRALKLALEPQEWRRVLTDEEIDLVNQHESSNT